MESLPTLRAAEPEVRAYLNRLENRLSDIDHALFLAWWNQYAGVSMEGTHRWDQTRTRLVGRDRLLAFVQRELERPHAELLTRRLELWKRIIEDALVEQHPDVIRLRAPLIRQVFAFRPRWQGRPQTEAFVRDRLRFDESRERRRRAALALLELWHQVEPGVRRLVRARNARAEQLGYRSFMEFRLRAEGLSVPRLEAMISRVVRASLPAQRRLRERFEDTSHVSDFYPWDRWKTLAGLNPLPESAFAGREMVPAMLRTIRGWGFRGPPHPFRIVQRSIPVGGMTLAVQIPSDVRVAVNPRGGWLNYSILAHEFGHAVHEYYTRAPSHVLRGPENIPGFAGFHEGIGHLFERIPGDAGWLAARPRVTPRLVREFSANYADEQIRDAGLTGHWVWKEMELYRHPFRNLASEFHRADRRVFGYDEYPETPVTDPFWIEAAFYSKSYLIATMVAAHLRRTLTEITGGPFWPNRKVIPWLRENWFRHGIRWDWVPRLEQLTGRAFGPSDFLRQEHHAG